jgi:nicotinate-nucleotide adenylyltransferase
VQRTGIFGGSFNPIHNGHIAVAEAALERFELGRVVFIPTNIQPLKEEDELAPFHDRLEMTRLAVSGNERLEVSDIEGVRGGVSYTIDTLRDIRLNLGEDALLYFIVGGDSVRDIPKWREPAEILEIAELIIYPREGFSADDIDCLSALVSEERLARVRENILETPLLPVSGTEIRRRLARGEPVEQFLHEDVAEYIEVNGLYS